MKNQFLKIPDKYAGDGMHYESRITRNGEIRQQLVCVCKVCGKDYPVKHKRKNRSTCCPECRKELKKMGNIKPKQTGSEATIEYK